MKTRTLLPVVASLFLSLQSGFAQTLYSEDFDTDHSANWFTRQGGSDSAADFYFDYSTLGIPSAPNSVGGTTRGMRFLANQSAGVQQGITGYPVGGDFNGNYRLRFDMWLNFNGPAPGGGSGSTQCGSFGIGATGASTLWAGSSPNGVMFATTAEGGSSIDYRAYYNNLLRPPADGVYAAGTASTSYNNTDPYYADFGNESAPAAQVALFPQQTGATGAGTLGWRWRDVIVEKNGNTITWTVDGKLLSTVDVSLVTTFSTNIFFGQFDINNTSSSDVNNFLICSIYDNVRVEALAGPQVDVTASTPEANESGVNGQFTFTRTGDTSAPLTVNYTVTGTASNGVDYATIPASVTFAAGSSSTNVAVSPVNDSVAEFTETVIITIASSGNYNVGGSPATVSILDNETPELSITASSSSMYERIAGDYSRFEISRKGDINAALYANLVYSGTDSTNFYGPSAISIDPTVVTVTFDVNPVDNTVFDGDKNLVVTVGAAGGGEYVVGTPGSANTTILDDELPAETTLFADPLTTDTSANWKTNFGASNLIDDYFVDFIADLGGDGVSLPPNGSPTALKLTVNKLEASAGGSAGINLYPNGQSFSGDFALRFNMYISQNSSSGTTEFALFGINHSGNKTNWNRQSTAAPNNPPLDSDGLWFSVISDGSGSAPADFALFTGTNAANTAIVLKSATATSLAQVFKHPPYLAALPGTPANIYATSGPWSDVEVKKIGSVVTMSINKTPIIVYTNATPFTSGDIMLGYMDPYDSIGSTGGAVYFSNVRVVQLAVPQPSITKLQLINGGTQVQIDFVGGGGDTTASFKLQSSSLVNTGYADDNAAAISTPSAGTFRFITSISGATQFYQIRHL